MYKKKISNRIVKKRWMLISLSALAFLGGSNLVVSNTAHANTINQNNNTNTHNYNNSYNNYSSLKYRKPSLITNHYPNNNLNSENASPISNQNTSNSINHNNIRQNTFHKQDFSTQLNHLQIHIIRTNLRHKMSYKIPIRHYHKYYRVSEGKKVHFTSQRGTDACEMAAIKNVLSIHHKALHTSLWTMLNRLGWGGNWNKCYTGNPYTGHGVTISPWLEARIIRKYGVHAHVHNYMNKKQIIHTLKKGHQLVIEAGHKCYPHHISYPHTPSDHILAIVGIKHNIKGLFVQYVDSEELTKKSGMKWCPFHRLWKSYNRPYITGNRAVIVTKNYRYHH